MGYKEKILELLDGNRYTSKELAEKLNITESDARVYINRIQKNDKDNIRVVGTENKYKVYTLIKKNLKNDSIDVQILKDGVLELNKLMSIVRPKIPSSIDKNRIIMGVEKCHTI